VTRIAEVRTHPVQLNGKPGFGVDIDLQFAKCHRA